MSNIISGIGGVLLVIGMFIIGGRDMFKSREERYRNSKEKWGKLEYIGLGILVLGLVIAAIGKAF